MVATQVVAGRADGSLTNFEMSPIVLAIKGLYQIAGSINDFINEHIDELKSSDNDLVASTGRVLEGAKHGFGLGYLSAITIVAAGQLLLGNPLSAAATVLTGATLTNPFAMTCAAVGAIYYGWKALTDQEQRQILERLSTGLAMGIELIRALLEFVVRATKDLMTVEQLAGFKEFVKAQAALFGKSLHDVTRRVGDLVKGGVEKAGAIAEQAVDATSSAAKVAYDATTHAGAKVVTTIKEAADRIGKDKSPSDGWTD